VYNPSIPVFDRCLHVDCQDLKLLQVGVHVIFITCTTLLCRMPPVSTEKELDELYADVTADVQLIGHSVSDTVKKKLNRHGFTDAEIEAINSKHQEQAMHEECMRREEIIKATLPEQIKGRYTNMVTGEFDFATSCSQCPCLPPRIQRAHTLAVNAWLFCTSPYTHAHVASFSSIPSPCNSQYPGTCIVCTTLVHACQYILLYFKMLKQNKCHLSPIPR
jgi:hypothetical protein